MNNTGVTMLSILIPTIPDRHSIFIELYGKLWRQMYHVHINHTTLGDIEWISDDTKGFLDGGLSIGKKRESLVQRATGKYLCFLDDDEDIAPNYVETLVRLCQQDKDVCTFRSIAKLDNYWTIIDMRLAHPDNEEANPGYIVHRRPWHINAIRSDIAKLYTFPDINYSEDSDWMTNVLFDCKTEAHTDAVIHQYNHSSKTSEADKIVKYAQPES